MTLAEVIALINSDIVPNGNNEITANVLRPILIEMLQQPNDLIGDLGDLNTDSSDTLVDAINSVNNALSDVEGLVILSGQGDPNGQSFPSLSIADLYSEIDGVGSPLALWIYDGTKFIRLSDKYLSYEIPQSLTPAEQLTARTNINATDRRLEELAGNLLEGDRAKIRQKISAASLEDVGNIIDDTQASDDTTYSSNVIDQKLNLKLDAEDLNGLLENPTYDSDTHIFTMDVVGGGTFSIDFPIEALITNVDLDDDNNLVITFEDGSVTTIPLNTLLVGVVKSVNGKTPNSQGVVTINIADIPNLQDELDNKADVSDIPTEQQIENWNTAFDWGDFRDYRLGVPAGGYSINFDTAPDYTTFHNITGDFFGINSTDRPSGVFVKGAIPSRWSWTGVTDKGPIRIYATNSENANNYVQIYHTGNFNPAQYVLQSALNTQLANYVPINGSTTINGTKTFTNAPIVPNGTLNSHAVNLGQLNDALDGNYLPLAGGTMENGSVINWDSGTNAVIQQGGNNRIRISYANTYISSSVSGANDGIYLRPRGDVNATGQVKINGNGQITTYSHGDSSQWHEAYLAIADKANTDGSNTTGGEWNIDALANNDVGNYVSNRVFSNDTIGIPSTNALGSATGVLLMRDGSPLVIAENQNPDWDGYIYRAGLPLNGYTDHAKTGNYLIESKHRFRVHKHDNLDDLSGGVGKVKLNLYNAIEHQYFDVNISEVIDVLELEIQSPLWDELTGHEIRRNPYGQRISVNVRTNANVMFTNVQGVSFPNGGQSGVYKCVWYGEWLFDGYSPNEF